MHQFVNWSGNGPGCCRCCRVSGPGGSPDAVRGGEHRVDAGDESGAIAGAPWRGNGCGFRVPEVMIPYFAASGLYQIGQGISNGSAVQAAFGMLDLAGAAFATMHGLSDAARMPNSRMLSNCRRRWNGRRWRLTNRFRTSQRHPAARNSLPLNAREPGTANAKVGTPRRTQRRGRADLLPCWHGSATRRWQRAQHRRDSCRPAGSNRRRPQQQRFRRFRSERHAS